MTCNDKLQQIIGMEKEILLVKDEANMDVTVVQK